MEKYKKSGTTPKNNFKTRLARFKLRMLKRMRSLKKSGGSFVPYNPSGGSVIGSRKLKK